MKPEALPLSLILITHLYKSLRSAARLVVRLLLGFLDEVGD